MPGAVRVEGPLDTAVLRAAVAEIVRRHEALRTVFELREGAPVQVVRHGMTVDVPETDLGGPRFTEADRQRWIGEALAEPFDIGTGPLLRVRLLRTGPDESVLAVAMHHLISDRWSTAVFLSELSELYEAFADGRPRRCPNPTSSTATSPPGSSGSWKRAAGSRTWPTGAAIWRARPPFSTCPPTGPAPPCRASTAPPCRSTCPRP